MRYKPPPIKFEYETDDGEWVEAELKTKWEVCSRCHGEGVHDHEAFSNGITPEQFAEDPDFEEDYFRGVYDVPCTVCKGVRLVPVPDKYRNSAELLRHYDEHLQAIWELEQEEAAERRMGA